MKKSKRKSENTSRLMKMETQLPKSMGCSKSSSKREVYSDTSLPQETRKISSKQPKLAPKAIRERRTNKQKTKLNQS